MSAQDKIAELELENSTLKKTVARLERRCNQLERRITGLDKIIVASDVVHANLTREQEQLMAELEARTRDLERALSELNTQGQALSEDLRRARALQESLRPTLPIPEGLTIAAIDQPAELVGGDFYEVQSLGPNRVRVLIGDATGHGVQASLQTLVVRTILERLRDRAADPSELLALLNEQLLRHRRDLPVQLAACCFDLDRDSLHWSNAGLPPIALAREGAIDTLYEAGPLVGLEPRAQYPLATCALRPGDRVFAYTDGLVEQWDDAGRRIPTDDVLRGFSEPGAIDDVVRGVLARLDRMRGRAPAPDDVTLLGVGVEPSGLARAEE